MDLIVTVFLLIISTRAASLIPLALIADFSFKKPTVFDTLNFGGIKGDHFPLLHVGTAKPI
ncbi:hypothetical protein MNBD_GAMMA16-823 [hydrothermal vent metagenome]|uniref:Uncharacterized protein n=1 Tax=hydrothermal vent metagenome TaxID=652676 RepID=A0A3B0ZKG4_9ZZZZ